MRLNAVKILGIFITNDAKEKILEEIKKYLSHRPSQKGKPLIIVTPNPEQIVLAQKNSRFAEILNRADIAIPDGGRLVWASKVLDQGAIPARIPGVEFMEELITVASGQSLTVGLIGGRGGVAVEAFECLQKKHSGLRGWGDERIDLDTIAKRIIKSNTRMVFVGLGAPKQEYFIESLSYHLSRVAYHPIVLMSVGGSFDIIAGRIPRAPLVIRSMGFEYIWRLLRQPWRVGRQLALVRFLLLVFLRKFSV